MPEIPKYIANTPELAAYLSLLHWIIAVLMLVNGSLIAGLVFMWRQKEAATASLINVSKSIEELTDMMDKR